MKEESKYWILLSSFFGLILTSYWLTGKYAPGEAVIVLRLGTASMALPLLAVVLRHLSQLTDALRRLEEFTVIQQAMQAMQARPEQVAAGCRKALLYLPMKREDRRVIAAQLEEEFGEIKKEFGEKAALRWYRYQVFRSFWPYVLAFFRKVVIVAIGKVAFTNFGNDVIAIISGFVKKR